MKDHCLLCEDVMDLLADIKSQLFCKNLGYNFEFSKKNFDAVSIVIPKKEVCYFTLKMIINSTEDGRIHVDYYVSLQNVVANRMYKAFSSELDFRSWLNSVESLNETINTTISLIEKYKDEY